MHLATAQFLVVVNPGTNLPAGIMQDDRQYIVGFTSVDVAERFFPTEAGRPLVTSVRQVLMRLAPGQYLVVDPIEPDPIVVEPGADRDATIRLSDPFPPLTRVARTDGRRVIQLYSSTAHAVPLADDVVLAEVQGAAVREIARAGIDVEVNPHPDGTLVFSSDFIASAS